MALLKCSYCQLDIDDSMNDSIPLAKLHFHDTCALELISDITLLLKDHFHDIRVAQL